MEARTGKGRGGERKSVLIIGAGIGGLSAGCYALMNGFEAEILESHDRPGGLCTDWKRGDFLFDGCIHWLMGSGPRNGFHRVWKELGAVQGRAMIDPEAFYSMRGADGRELVLYADPGRLERHLLELSPADAKPARELCSLVRKLADMAFPLGAEEVQGPLAKLGFFFSILPRLGPFIKAVSTPIEAFASRFSDPFLREAFSRCFHGIPGITLYPLVFTLGGLWRKAAGYPVGGSGPFAEAVARRFSGLGGVLRCGCRVERILVEGGRAVGVLAGGKEYRADWVVSAMDMETTYRELLGGMAMDPSHEHLMREGLLTPAMTLVSLGLGRDLGAEAGKVGEIVLLPEPAAVCGTAVDQAFLRVYGPAAGLAPPGKSIVEAAFMTGGDCWERLSSDRDDYRAEKGRVRALALGILERRWPGSAAEVEAVDVATPLTFRRYTGNRKGSYMTWNLDGAFRERFKAVSRTVPGLENFLFSSMWSSPPGGLPGAAMAGREAAEHICAKEGRRFKTGEPTEG